MVQLTVKEVADVLGVQEIRVERLQREHLLIAKGSDDDGNPLFDEEDVKRYQELAKRLGGL